MSNRDIKRIYDDLVEEYERADNITDKIRLSGEIRALDDAIADGGFDVIDTKRLSYNVSQLMRDVDHNDDISMKAKTWVKDKLQELVQ